MGGSSTGGEEQKTFSSTAGIVFSCLGTVVGTGNIWRFPRIAAQNSASGGTLIFLATWMVFLFIWSSPMLLIEYAVGRYFKKSPIQSFKKAMGDKFVWCGAWVTMVTFLISCYYSVVLGWCFYYVYKMIHMSVDGGLPATDAESEAIFNDFVIGSSWPVLTHGMAVLLSGLCVVGGITWIEKANMVLVPTLLIIIIFTFVWAVIQPFSDYGITFLFSPDVASLDNPRLWVDSASQNAFDTGAAMGLIVPYATYMTRENGVVRYSMLIPAMNNFVSLICALTIFSTVFSTLVSNIPIKTLSRTGIVEIIKTSGPASTGLTFIWMPVLFEKVGVIGNILSVLFFFCLSCAGLSSLIANIELTSLTMTDFGLPRKLGTPLCLITMFLIGLGSAMDIKFLENQDFVWGFALMISGMMFQLLVIRYGWRKFQKYVVNEYGEGDWPLTIVTMIIIIIIAPLEAIGLLIWWGYDIISSTADAPIGFRWFDFNIETFLTVISEWLGLLIILLLINLALYHLKFKKEAEHESMEEKEMQNVTNVYEEPKGIQNPSYVREEDDNLKSFH